MSQVAIGHKQEFMPATQYRRNLPHIHPDGYPLFITFRLAGSIPMEVVLELKMQRARELRASTGKSSLELREIEERYFNCYDKWLDSCSIGPRWLENESIAQIVSEKNAGDAE